MSHSADEPAVKLPEYGLEIVVCVALMKNTGFATVTATSS